MNALTVVLDTNALLSGLAYPTSAPGKIVAAWRSGGLAVCSSTYILEELHRVLPRLAHRHGLSDQQMADLVEILRFQVECVEPSRCSHPALRDSDDQPVLGTLIAAMEQHDASYLITGDKGLLELANQYPIVTPSLFWRKHGPV